MCIEGQGHFFTIYFPGFVTYVLCFTRPSTRPRYQVSVYRDIGPLFFIIILNIEQYLYALLTIPSTLGSHPPTPSPTHPLLPPPRLPPPTLPTTFFLHFHKNLGGSHPPNRLTPPPPFHLYAISMSRSPAREFPDAKLESKIRVQIGRVGVYKCMRCLLMVLWYMYPVFIVFT